jgi:hypothetical protein
MGRRSPCAGNVRTLRTLARRILACLTALLAAVSAAVFVEPPAAHAALFTVSAENLGGEGAQSTPVSVIVP